MVLLGRIELPSRGYQPLALPLSYRSTGAADRIRTCIFVPVTLVSVRSGAGYCGVEEAVGFEPTEPFGSSDFKSGALNQAQPRFQFECYTGTKV